MPGSPSAGCPNVREKCILCSGWVHAPFLPHQPRLWAALWPSPQFCYWLSLPPALVHTVLAQLLTVLAEICDAGTPHRKEPAGYAEAGPSGPL